MNSDDFQKIVEYLKNLASPVVEKGWDLVYRQVVFLRIQDFVWLLVAVVASFFIIKYSIKFFHWCMDENNEECSPALIFPVFGLFGLGAIIISNLLMIINFLVNPEWQVIEMILKTISGK